MTNAEKQKRYREKRKALRTGGIVTEVVTVGGCNGVKSVTETDRLFEEAKPGYWIFEDGEPWERKCWMCGVEYRTRLELNKFCGPGCKERWLRESFRSMKGKTDVKGISQ